MLLRWPKPVSYPLLPSWKRPGLTDSPDPSLVLKQLAQGRGSRSTLGYAPRKGLRSRAWRRGQEDLQKVQGPQPCESGGGDPGDPVVVQHPAGGGGVRWAPAAGEEGSGRLLAPGARRAPRRARGAASAPPALQVPGCHPWVGAPPHPILLPVNPASAPAAEPGLLHRQGLLDFSSPLL